MEKFEEKCNDNKCSCDASQFLQKYKEQIKRIVQKLDSSSNKSLELSIQHLDENGNKTKPEETTEKYEENDKIDEPKTKKYNEQDKTDQIPQNEDIEQPKGEISKESTEPISELASKENASEDKEESKSKIDMKENKSSKIDLKKSPSNMDLKEMKSSTIDLKKSPSFIDLKESKSSKTDMKEKKSSKIDINENKSSIIEKESKSLKTESLKNLSLKSGDKSVGKDDSKDETDEKVEKSEKIFIEEKPKTELDESKSVSKSEKSVTASKKSGAKTSIKSVDKTSKTSGDKTSKISVKSEEKTSGKSSVISVKEDRRDSSKISRKSSGLETEAPMLSYEVKNENEIDFEKLPDYAVIETSEMGCLCEDSGGKKMISDLIDSMVDNVSEQNIPDEIKSCSCLNLIEANPSICKEYDFSTSSSSESYVNYQEIEGEEQEGYVISFGRNEEEEETEEIKMSSKDTKTKEEKYLEDHKINDLFNYMVSQMLVSEPDNPVSFLVNLLDKCIMYRNGIVGPPLLFSERHLISVFKSMDPMGYGYITIEQYETAMFTLGVKEYNRYPNVSEDGIVLQKVFVEEALIGLRKKLDGIVKIHLRSPNDTDVFNLSCTCDSTPTTTDT